MVKKILWFSALSLICSEAFALIFSVSPTDKSLGYLGTIFGGSVGAISLGGAINPTLSKMFQGFNFIIVSMGSIALGYLGILSTINTAREGEAMGKKLNLWVPMRSILGLLLMIPTPGTGYSVVQMTVMWIVLNGIGAANSVWNIALNQLASGVQAVGTVSVPLKDNGYANLQTLSSQILYSSTCMAFVNNQINNGTLTQTPFTAGAQVTTFLDNQPSNVTSNPSGTSLSQSTTLHVGLRGVAGWTDICGTYTINEIITCPPGPNSNITCDNATVTQRLQYKTQALQAMFSTVQDAAQLLARGSTQINPGYINAGADAYINLLATSLLGTPSSTQTNQNPGSRTSGFGNVTGTNIGAAGGIGFQGGAGMQFTIPSNAPPTGTMAQLGWAHAGSFYFQIVGATGGSITDPDLNYPGNTPTYRDFSVTSNTAMQNTDNTCSWLAGASAPLCNILIGAKQLSGLYNDLIHATSYASTDRNTPPPSIDGIMNSPNNVTGNGAVDALINPIFNSLNAPVYAFMSNLTTSDDDPLKSIAKYGHGIMMGAESGIFVLIMALAYFILGSSWSSCISAFANFSVSIGGYVFFLVLGLCAMLWGLGATLGVYTPLIPFLVFTTSVFSWFIAVIEAVVAAPILALGLTHASGEELGKVGAGIVILANLFLRPTLMIFGFILGANLLRAALSLVNFGIMAAIHESIQPTLFSFIPLMAMYAALVIGLVNQSFSLVYKLPNQIMRWLGGGAESHEPGELVGKAKEGAETGGKTVSEGIGKAADSVQKKGKDKKDAMDKLPKE